MSNGHFIKIFCPNLKEEGIINGIEMPKTCPLCGCVIAKTDGLTGKEFYTCDLQTLQVSA